MVSESKTPAYPMGTIIRLNSDLVAAIEHLANIGAAFELPRGTMASAEASRRHHDLLERLRAAAEVTKEIVIERAEETNAARRAKELRP